MKKKLLLTFALILSLVMIFAACSAGSWGPVKGGPSASDAVQNNGSMVVKKGDFYYYINGKAGQSDSNKFGEVIKGAIVRSKSSDIKDSSKQEIIVPKIMLNSASESGFYIFGEHIYYTTPSVEKDKEGVVQSSYLEFWRSKLDGTKAEKLFMKSSASLVHKMFEKDGKIFVAYIDNSKLNVYDVNAKKDSVVVEEYTGTPMMLASGEILFTQTVYLNKADDKELPDMTAEKFKDNADTVKQAKYNKVMAFNVFTGETKEIKKDVKFTYTLSTLDTTQSGTQYIYYTQVEVAGGNNYKALKRCENTFNDSTATVISYDTAITGFLTAYNGDGYYIQGTSAITWVKNDNGELKKMPILNVTGATLSKVITKGDDSYLYFTDSSAKVQRMLLPKNFSATVVWDDGNKTDILGKEAKDTFGTDWIKPVYFAGDDLWFFFNSGSDAFDVDPDNEKTHATFYFRSGYMFVFTEANGEDAIVNPVRIGILTKADKESEAEKLEDENERRDDIKEDKK